MSKCWLQKSVTIKVSLISHFLFVLNLIRFLTTDKKTSLKCIGIESECCITFQASSRLSMNIWIAELWLFPRIHNFKTFEYLEIAIDRFLKQERGPKITSIKEWRGAKWSADCFFEKKKFCIQSESSKEG